MFMFIFFLIFLGIALVPLAGAVLLFRVPFLRSNRIKPVRIFVLLILSLLPLYWTALYFQILPLPASGDNVAPEVYRFYNSDFDASLPDQLIGGGYQWFPEGSDLWMRFQSEEQYEVQDEKLLCDPKELMKMSKWFSQHIRTPQDQENLRDYDNLVCSGSFGYTPIEDNKLFWLPSPPSNCSESWQLYHIPTRFVYYRFRCDVI